MYNKIIIVLFLLLPLSVFCQEPEILKLKDGKTVLLYPDNTWKYASEIIETQTNEGKDILLLPDSTWQYKSEADTSYVHFFKPEKSTKKLSDSTRPYSLWINENEWEVIEKKDSSLGFADYILESKNSNVQAMVIFNDKKIEPAVLINNAVEKARKINPNAGLVDKQERIINGSKILAMRMKVFRQNRALDYYNYYYSGGVGTIQVITFVPEEEFESSEDEMLNLLNGLVVYEWKQKRSFHKPHPQKK